ncbi:MAG: hypothetical protein U5N85_13165 [Arcicella sp.]|nr:hypothetical protein [Arcicella sp.]
MVRVTTLNNKVYKGLMFQVRDKDFLVLPNSVRWDFNVKKNNISRTRSFDYRIVKEIKIRRKGRIGKGILIGYVVGTALGILIVKNGNYNRDGDILGITQAFRAMGTLLLTTSGGTLLGGVVGGAYPNQFEVKKDSTSIQTLKIELKKYEWYHAEKDTLIIK